MSLSVGKHIKSAGDQKHFPSLYTFSDPLVGSSPWLGTRLNCLGLDISYNMCLSGFTHLIFDLESLNSFHTFYY